MRLTTKSLRKKTKQTRGFYCMVTAEISPPPQIRLNSTRIFFPSARRPLFDWFCEVGRGVLQGFEGMAVVTDLDPQVRRVDPPSFSRAHLPFPGHELPSAISSPNHGRTDKLFVKNPPLGLRIISKYLSQSRL